MIDVDEILASIPPAPPDTPDDCKWESFNLMSEADIRRLEEIR